MTIEEALQDMEKEQINENPIEEIEKNTEENMSIYQKLTYIQNDLLEIPIPKNGKNPFGGFNYYELEDLLPPILKLCKKYGCTLYFNFPSIEGTCHSGVLNLINWNDKYDAIKVEVPFPQLEKLPKMNYAQVSGTYQTYMKRYLILHTFDIVEKEVIDSGFLEQGDKKRNNSTKKSSTTSKSNGTQTKSVSKTNDTQTKSTPKSQNNSTSEDKSIDSLNQEKNSNDKTEKPECFQKVIDKCHELYSEKECNWKLLNKVSLKMFNDKELTLDERKQIFNYIKTLR